jgi:hypothetical protein
MAYVEHAPARVLHEDKRTHGAVVARRVVMYVLDILEVLLAFRFFLRLLAANAASGFVEFIARLTEPFVFPFRGIFPAIASHGSVLDWGVLLAMIVYALVVWGVVRLIWIMFAHDQPEETETLQQEEVRYHDDGTAV